MKNYYQLALAASIFSVSLSSCSRTDYAFNNKGSAYLGSEQVRLSTPTTSEETAIITATATTEIAQPTVEIAPARQAAAVLAHSGVKAQVTAKKEVAAMPALASQKLQLTKVEKKNLKKEIKRQLVAAPNNTSVEGKSQIVAAVLCFFLGGLGIHDFYLGRVGKGILQIFLSLILVGFILVIIDFIRILIGTEKPKDGEYAKKI